MAHDPTILEGPGAFGDIGLDDPGVGGLRPEPVIRAPSADSVSTLRGAGVEVDARRVAGAVAFVCLLGLAVLVAILFVAAVQKNAQITRLRQQGVPVQVTMTGCIGLAGGSGSNLAGYECRGSFNLGGRRYNEVIPGSAFRRPGSTVAAVAVADDASLVTTAAALETEHASAGAFVLPTILLVVLLAAVTGVLLRRRLLAGQRLRDEA